MPDVVQHQPCRVEFPHNCAGGVEPFVLSVDETCPGGNDVSWVHEPWKARRAGFQPGGPDGIPAAQVF